MTDAVIHLLSLLRSREQVCHRAVSHRHIVEVPHKQGSALDHHIVERLAAHILKVLACIAYRDTEREFILFHQFHRMAHFVIYAVSAPSVVGLLKSLQADRRDKIFHPEHFLTELFIDHRSVCKCKELTVRMHLTDLEDIFPAHRGLSAGVDVHVCTQLFALTNDRVNVLQTQVILMAVLCRPASGAVQVARRCGIEEDRPGDIAVVFLCLVFLNGTSFQAGIRDKVLKECPAHSRIELIQAQDQLIPVILIRNRLPDCIPLACIPVRRHKTVYEIHQFRNILFRIPLQIFQSLIDCKFLHCFFNRFSHL